MIDRLPADPQNLAQAWVTRRAKYGPSGLGRPPIAPAERFEMKVDRHDASGCHLWTGAKDRKGYGRFDQRLAHRFSWELEHGPIPDGLCVLHRCDVPACVNTSHLFLGTHVDNMADMAAKRRSAVGERNGRARLTDAQVLEIRHQYATLGVTQRYLAEQFGCTQSQIGYIVNLPLSRTKRQRRA